MILAISVAVLLSANPVSLASPGFSYVDVPEKKGDFFADHFAQQLSLYGLRVTTKSEMSAVIGLERQKQLLGCSDASSSCLAELAGALGADGIVTGSLAKFRGGYTLNIKIISAADAKPIAVASTKDKDDDALVEWLSETAKQLAPKIIRALRPNGSTADTANSDSTSVATLHEGGAARPSVIIPAVAGGVLLVGGGVCLFVAKGIQDDLTNPKSTLVGANATESIQNAHDAAQRGNLYATLGYIGVGVGVAGLATAAVMAFTGGSSDVHATVMPTSGGAAFAFGGSF